MSLIGTSAHMRSGLPPAPGSIAPSISHSLFSQLLAKGQAPASLMPPGTTSTSLLGKYEPATSASGSAQTSRCASSGKYEVIHW